MYTAWGGGLTKRTHKTKLRYCMILEWRIQLQDTIDIDGVIIGQ